MNELYERDDLADCITAYEANRARLARQLDDSEIDGDTFRRRLAALRLTLIALREALAIQRGETEPTAMYEQKVRAAADAVRLARDWDRMDAELRDLLEARKCD